MSHSEIRIKGAREHNLKNVDLTIPRDKLVVFTGLSGSGKSSLAFDTLYAEGQRRYVESLSAYARQFLGQMDKPDVDDIQGLSPAIAIQQRAPSHNPRSTVATTTEIYDYLRLLFARVGRPHCPKCGKPIQKQTVDQIVDQVMSHPAGSRVGIFAPVVRGRKGEYKTMFDALQKQGFIRIRVNGTMYELGDKIPLDKKRKQNIEVVVDRLVVKPEVKSRLTDSLETALKLAKGVVVISVDGKEQVVSEEFACADCGISIPELAPRMFSFNSPFGACQECTGLGIKNIVDPKLVVPDPTKSVRAGAIHPWSSPHAYIYRQQLEEIANRYRMDLTKPFCELKREFQQMILYGTDGYEGVIPNLERRFRETTSDWVREEVIGSYMNEKICPACKGARLQPVFLAVKVGDRSIHEVSGLSVKSSLQFFESLRLSEKEMLIAKQILKEIQSRLKFLYDVGLDYLTLNRSTGSLSGGEAQRIHLATQIGSSLMGVLYILDEPSIGLHQRDNAKLLATLKKLRDIGNTVVVVEHDEETIREADFVVDLGPGAGVHGGEVVAAGPLEAILNAPASLTGRYLRGEVFIPVPRERRASPRDEYLELQEASINNLKDVTLRIPLGSLTVVTGVSGSGKSSLISETLHPALAHALYQSSAPSSYRKLVGVKAGQECPILHVLDKVINIDQSPIGRTPRSNPATYTGVFTPIREIFAMTAEARVRGYQPGRFSFNVKGGRCEACEGDGLIKIEMHFLPPVYVPCEVCKGQRYNRESLEVKYKGKNISEILDLIIEQALEFFRPVPQVARMLQTLVDVGLGYIKLGQPATTLSGGEAQRVKLSTELAKRSTGRTLYILDEPTTGLHFADIHRLLEVLARLVDAGNTVVVIEHNLDVIKTADYLVDLGPEGGEDGGRIVFAGTPEEMVQEPLSYTGRFLAPLLLKREPMIAQSAGGER